VGTTKKRAEQEAARRAFDKLRKQSPAREPLAEGNGS
jgi:dsRNA-specific ribonuclease